MSPDAGVLKPGLVKDLLIEKMAFGAKGIGRLEGKTVFVSGAVPGDEVKIQIVEDKGSFFEARVQQFIKKSSVRQDSRCQFSDKCGGCQWQEVAPEVQKEWKWQFVKDALKRIARLDLPSDSAFVAADNPFYYRNRALLRGTVSESGDVRAGFFKKSSRIQIPVNHCAIVEPALNTVIQSLQALHVKASPQTFRLELQYFLGFAGKQKAGVTALIHPVSPKGRELDSLVDALQALPEIVWAGSTLDKSPRPVLALEQWENLKYYSSPGQFFQVNRAQNAVLRELVSANVAKSGSGVSVLDLFCGSGNLSLMLARVADRVTGVESNPGSVGIAKYAAKANGLENVSFYAQDSLRFLKKQVEQKKTFDVIIADPPRAGMKACLPYLMDLAPELLIYVSCDPATLARDLGKLHKDYEICSLRALDFFPQTYHIESFVVLKKRAEKV